MRSRAIVVLGVLGSALVTGGWLVERGFRGGSSVSGPRLFDEVMTHIDRYYVDSVGQADLYGKAVDGMLRELGDPHTVFLRSDRLARLTENTTGNYGGVGIQIDVRDGWVIVVSPLPGSPAERAGIETGDRIVEVAGKSARGWTIEETRNALRGPPGSSVSFTIERLDSGDRTPLTLVRREIHRSAVRISTLLSDGIGFVDVDAFSDSTEVELRRAIDSLSSAGMRSLVLDLRANPGGLLTQGVGVADLFLDPEQKIVGMRGRVREANRDFVDRAPQRWPRLPVVVLVDEYSASASEIVAGALQDHDRALVVGRTSYGKGSAQTLYPITGGSALKLTTARWFTPKGRSISKPTGDSDDEVGEDGEVSVPPPAPRDRFTTNAGRTVYGGGGITPDVPAGDTIVPPEVSALQSALGTRVPQFRDAINEYALALKASRSVTSPDFVVTDAMRDELWRRMVQRGIRIDRSVYDSAGAFVGRLLAYDVVRYTFGRLAEQRRIVQDDPVVGTAVGLLRGAATPAELLSRAPARPKPPADE